MQVFQSPCERKVEKNFIIKKACGEKLRSCQALCTFHCFVCIPQQIFANGSLVLERHRSVRAYLPKM